MERVILAVVPLLTLVPILWIMFWLMSRSMDRRLGGRGQATMLRKALRTGAVPDDADRERWAERSAQAVRRRPHTWVGWTIIVLLVAVTVTPLLGDQPPTTTGLVYLFGVNGVFVALVYIGLIRAPRRYHRHWRRLDAQLNGPTDAGSGVA